MKRKRAKAYMGRYLAQKRLMLLKIIPTPIWRTYWKLSVFNKANSDIDYKPVSFKSKIACERFLGIA